MSKSKCVTYVNVTHALLFVTYVFNAPDVVKAGGLEALKVLAEPKDIDNETKRRLFAA